MNLPLSAGHGPQESACLLPRRRTYRPWSTKVSAVVANSGDMNRS